MGSPGSTWAGVVLPGGIQGQPPESPRGASPGVAARSPLHCQALPQVLRAASMGPQPVWMNLGLVCNHGAGGLHKIKASGPGEAVSQTAQGPRILRRWARAVFHDLTHPYPEEWGMEAEPRDPSHSPARTSERSSKPAPVLVQPGKQPTAAPSPWPGQLSARRTRPGCRSAPGRWGRARGWPARCRGAAGPGGWRTTCPCR